MSYDDDDDDKKPWGYASCDVDDETGEHLTYTRYETSGRVNRYTDNGDGGHSHSTWADADDYNAGEDPDWSRSESNDSPNPSDSEVEERSGCYLTSACMQHMSEDFDDKCYELELLRWFRDNFVSQEDIKHYYKVAPLIVQKIDVSGKRDKFYSQIYDKIVFPCVKDIEQGNYQSAYDRYKFSVKKLENRFVHSDILKKDN